MFAYFIDTAGRDVLVNTSKIKEVTFHTYKDRQTATIEYINGESLQVRCRDFAETLDELNAPYLPRLVEVPGSGGVYINPAKVVEAGGIWKGVQDGQSSSAIYLVFDNGRRREFNTPQSGDEAIARMFPEPTFYDGPDKGCEPRDQQDKDNQ